MNICKINGKSYDVLVISIEESFTILYSENTGRSMSPSARMTLDPLGTFITHKVTFKKKSGKEAEYDELYNMLMTPTDVGVSVEMAHNQTYIAYDAYVSTGGRKLKRADPITTVKHWDMLTVDFIPMEAQILP